MKMYVYASKSVNPWSHELTAIVIETNLEYAIPYWTARKKSNSKLFWEFK